MAKFGNSGAVSKEYDTIEEFINYYHEEFSINYHSKYFFIKPKDRVIINSGRDRLSESIEVREPFLLGDSLIRYAPRIYQNYMLRGNPFFADAEYVSVVMISNGISTEDLGERLEFEFCCKRWKETSSHCFYCNIEVFINQTYAGTCLLSSAYDSYITQYEAANFLYSNYMILSPETAEE